MCSGLIISKNHNYQDFRKMGNYVSMSFFEYFILTISLLNLASIPFTIGFFNKHYFIALF
ncbi:MAG: hypothetical protein KDH96_12220 [Candidatus Riesia sp.]|nr:hypothetical protein [Candidatus Riesia sp.]